MKPVSTELSKNFVSKVKGVFCQVEGVCDFTKITSDQSVDLIMKSYKLLKKVANFSDHEKFFILLIDEIQENLVCDKHIDELTGYVDLGDIESNYTTL